MHPPVIPFWVRILECEVERSRMKPKRRPSFDPKAFLAKADGERTITNYREIQIVFSQADPADSVFYIQEGKIKLTVVSTHGKEAVVARLG